MKNLIVILLLSLSLFSSAQKIGGFYKGVLYNDSTKMTQNYELALAEYRGKIMGYAYVTFIANDTFYYGIRKINAKIVGDSLIVEDDKFIANNFPESPAKHVSRTVTIPLAGQKDSLVNINGRWKTNRTKIYYSVPGSVTASRSNDSSASALFAHLKELNLMPNSNNYVNTESQTTVETKTKNNKEETDPTAKTKTKRSKEETDPTAETKIKNRKETDTTAELKSSPRTTTVKLKEDKTKIRSEKESVADRVQPAVLRYDQRANHVQQTVEVSSDSLILSFYDNGVVDGDSISVYMNGEPVVYKVLLKSTASKKTIYLKDNTDVQLVLVAESMGTIPPNTGLLVIHDGDKSYQINFSADYQTNASIVLRRKKNQ